MVKIFVVEDDSILHQMICTDPISLLYNARGQ